MEKGFEVRDLAFENLAGAVWNRPGENAEEGLEVLKASMVRQGQLEDIVVRPMGKGIFEVISGHRRIRAAMELGWKTVRARIVEAGDEEARALAFAVNHARKNAGIFWESVECWRRVKAGASVEEVAGALGHSEAWVRRRLRLDFEACQRLKGILDKAGIPVEGVHAHSWMRLGEFSDRNWEWAEGFAERDPKGFRDVLASPSGVSTAMWDDFVKVEGMPWSGATKDAPACAKCPHCSGEVASLFPEFAAAVEHPGCCTHRECAEGKKRVARVMAMAAGKQLAEGRPVYKVEDLPGGVDAWVRVKRESEATVLVVDGGDRSGEWWWARALREVGAGDKGGARTGGTGGTTGTDGTAGTEGTSGTVETGRTGTARPDGDAAVAKARELVRGWVWKLGTCLEGRKWKGVREVVEEMGIWAGMVEGQ